jgi:hypothetical protein
MRPKRKAASNTNGCMMNLLCSYPRNENGSLRVSGIRNTRPLTTTRRPTWE